MDYDVKYYEEKEEKWNVWVTRYRFCFKCNSISFFNIQGCRIL